MRFSNRILLSVFASLAIGTTLFGSEAATGIVNLKSTSGSGANQTFTYAVTITDTGTTNISSFWYSWLPPDNFYDFLVSKPTAEVSPSGWIATLEGTNNGTTDDNSILWTTTSAPLTPSKSLTFDFTTTDDFASVTGASTPYGYPRGYSYIYSGAPEAPGDSGALLNVAAGSSTPVPEPASVGILAAGAGLLALRRRRATRA